MIGYMYTLSPDGTPIYLQYLWASTDGNAAPVGYLLKNLVPKLHEETQGFGATVVEYPSIGLKIPVLKYNGYPIEDYVESGFLKKENLQYIEFNGDVKKYITDYIAVLDENAVVDWEYFSSYRNPLGNPDSLTVGEKHRQDVQKQQPQLRNTSGEELSAAVFGKVEQVEAPAEPEMSIQENRGDESTKKSSIPLVFPILLEEGTYTERERARNGIPASWPNIDSDENITPTIVRDKIPSEFPNVQ